MSPDARAATPTPAHASWLVGDDGATVHADTRCRRLLGLERTDGLRGLTVWSVVAAEDHDRLLAAFRCSASYDGDELPLRLRRPDGALVDVRARLDAVRDDTGERQAWLLELTPAA